MALPPAVAEQPGETPQVITRSKLQDLLSEAADRAAKAERQAAKRSREAALDALSDAHKAELSRVAAETVEREKAAHAHGFHKASWMVGGPLFLAGGLVAAGLVLISQDVAWQNGADATRQGVTAGAVIQSAREAAGVGDER